MFFSDNPVFKTNEGSNVNLARGETINTVFRAKQENLFIFVSEETGYTACVFSS